MRSNILVPLDGTEVGERALPWASKTARQWDATIHLLQVVKRRADIGIDGRSFSTPAERSYGMVRGWSKGGVGSAIDYLARIAAGLRLDGHHVRTAIHEGAPIERILSYAMVNSIDLIAVGTRGDSGPTRLIRSIRNLAKPSVSRGVQTRSELPIMLCHRADGYLTRLTETPTILSAKFLRQRELVLEIDLPSKFATRDRSPVEEALMPSRNGANGKNELGLSPREVEVLQLVAAGRSNVEIADLLFISAHTVSHHISNILQKTGATNRAEAAVTGARTGVLG